MDNTLVLCCPVQNYFDQLQKVLPTWVSKHCVKGIVVCDYGSDNNLFNVLSENNLLFCKVDVVRVEESLFNMAKARNIAIRSAHKIYNLSIDDKIMLIDSDIAMVTNLHRRYFCTNKIIYTGFRHSRGTCIMPLSIFYELNGFNETRFFGGSSDIHFYTEAKNRGWEHKRIRCYNLMHLDHEYRTKNLSQSDPDPNWHSNGKMETVSVTLNNKERIEI